MKAFWKTPLLRNEIYFSQITKCFKIYLDKKLLSDLKFIQIKIKCFKIYLDNKALVIRC